MDVLNEFQIAIEIERLKNLEDYNEQMEQPLDERIDAGITMSNLKVEFEFFNGPPNPWCNPLPNPQKYISSAKIYCDNNISKFKEGNSVHLSNGNYKFEMEIYEDSTENFILKPNSFNERTCYINSIDYPKHNWEINIIHTGIGTRLLKTAADILNNNDSTLDKINKFLNGKTQNNYNSYFQRVGYLNESQNSAYLKAINASDFGLIQGPPGTGKTETIGNIVKLLVDNGLKVFVSAPTHTAINNCLNAVSSKIKDSSKVVKIGEKVQYKEIEDNKYITKEKRLTYANYRINPKLNQNGIAIGATVYSLCYPTTKRLDGWEFDVAIIDEASQLSIPLSIAAMCRTDKYIFVGDHKQLDPIIPKESGNEMFTESIFGRLARLYPNEINLLKTSYRLNESLIKIPNALFYNNQLHSDATTKHDNMQYQCSYHPEILNNDSHILVLHDNFDGKQRSPFEAETVSELVYDLLQNGISLNEIGIMSPYRAQVREIKKEIKQRLQNYISNPFKDLLVDTVDSMQGQERDYIIYSMANTHPLSAKVRLDFFYSPNRLNVAITRAIKKCFVISNYKVFDIIDAELQDSKKYHNIKDNLNIFKKYYELSTKIELNQLVDDEW